MPLQQQTKRPPEGGLFDLNRALKPTQLPFFGVARQSVRLGHYNTGYACANDRTWDSGGGDGSSDGSGINADGDF
jgi:hypothetical protein